MKKNIRIDNLAFDRVTGKYILGDAKFTTKTKDCADQLFRNRLMISKEEIVNAQVEGFRKNPYFNGFEIRKHSSGDFEFLNESSDSIRSFSWRFLIKNNAYEIDQLSTKST